MKNLIKVIFCVVAIITMQTVASAQIGYSVNDNNRDSTGNEQQYYSINFATGQGTLIQNLGGLRREYEGLGSSGGVLMGVAEFDGELCNTGSDPITGLSSDLRIFTPTGVGRQIGETCIDFGSESAGAYNPQDGWYYAIASDDLLPATAARSRLYRVSPTSGLATLVSTITLASGSTGGEAFPYLDGLAILPNGVAYATENRFGPTAQGERGSLYRIFLNGPNAGQASFIKNTLTFDANRDTAFASLDNGTLYLMLEDGRVYIGNANDANPFTPAVFSAGNPAGSNTISAPGCIRTTPFCGDFEGLDFPNNGAGLR